MHLWMVVWVHMHLWMSVWVHMRLWMSVWVHMHLWMSVNKFICTLICLLFSACTPVGCPFECRCTWMYVHQCMCTWKYVCLSVYALEHNYVHLQLFWPCMHLRYIYSVQVHWSVSKCVPYVHSLGFVLNVSALQVIVPARCRWANQTVRCI